MILVTGGTGLVGGHLLYRFRESELPITAIYRNKAQLDKTRAIFNSYKLGDAALVDRFNWVQADVTDVPSLELIMPGIKTIYHCAALIEASFKELKAVNVVGTENVVNVALAYGVEKMCYVSSIAALGEPLGNSAIDEEDFFNLDALNSHYGLSKYGAEMEVWRASQEGMHVIIINPGVIIGEGNWDKGSGKLFSKTAGNQPFYTSGSTGFVDVRDVTAIMQQLTESAVVNERFIAVAKNTSYKDLLTGIAKSLSKKPPHFLLKSWMLYIVYGVQLLGTIIGAKLTLSRATIKSLVHDSSYSNEKVVKQLQYTFLDINASVERIAASYLTARQHK